MKQIKWLLFCLPLLIAFVGCETWKDIGKFDANKGNIKKVALLPLYIDPNVANISLGNPEVKGFQDAWKLEFNDEFKKRIVFINGIEILYPGVDFDVTPDMMIEPNYAKIVDNLKVDLVMGFSLVQYNEVSQGEAVGEFCLAAIFDTPTENMVASFDYSNVSLDNSNLYSRVNIVLGGVLPTNEAQRTQFMDKLIEWVDKNHPLSVNYKK